MKQRTESPYSEAADVPLCHARRNGALKDASTPEAPHIYKVDGAHYLVIGEAGTYFDHAVTIARSDRYLIPS